MTRIARGRGEIFLIEMFMRPLAVLASSIEMIGQSVPGMQRLDGIVSRIAHTLSRPWSNHQGLKSEATQVGNNTGEDHRPLTAEKNGPADQTISLLIESARSNSKQMNEDNSYDTCLSDDMLKLVQYKVLFIKRDYEVAFPEQEELVYDNLTATDYTAWKIAEFIQNLDKTDVPTQWQGGTDGGQRPNYPQDPEYLDGRWVINRLPEDDKKYLRVYFKVLDRYKREGLRYKQRQLGALKDIAKALKDEKEKLPLESRAAGSPAETQEGQPLQPEATEPESTQPRAESVIPTTLVEKRVKKPLRTHRRVRDE